MSAHSLSLSLSLPPSLLPFWQPCINLATLHRLNLKGCGCCCGCECLIMLDFAFYYIRQVGNTRALHVFNSFFLFVSVCLFPIILFSSLSIWIKPFWQPCNWQLDNVAQKVVCGCGCGCECLIM